MMLGMDLQAIEAVTDRLAAEFSIRPPKVTSGRVPRSMGLGVRGKLLGRRFGLVIGPAAEHLEPDELEGELAVAMALFALRRGYFMRLWVSVGAVLVCQFILLAFSAGAPGWWSGLIIYAAIPLWPALSIAEYRGLIYRADRRVADVLGSGTLLAVLDAERRTPSNGWFHFWSLPHADRRAARITPLITAHGETTRIP